MVCSAFLIRLVSLYQEILEALRKEKTLFHNFPSINEKRQLDKEQHKEWIEKLITKPEISENIKKMSINKIVFNDENLRFLLVLKEEECSREFNLIYFGEFSEKILHFRKKRNDNSHNYQIVHNISYDDFIEVLIWMIFLCMILDEYNNLIK